jgi:hypothetical protein
MSPRSPRSSRSARSRGTQMIRDIGIMLGAFALSSALAGLFGAVNLGTALAFGQMGFAAALVWVLVRR